MIRQIKHCIIVVAVGIVLVSAQVSSAWHNSRGCRCSSGYGVRGYDSSRDERFSYRYHQRPRTYGQYEYNVTPSNPTGEYERQRALYGFLNL